MSRYLTICFCFKWYLLYSCCGRCTITVRHASPQINHYPPSKECPQLSCRKIVFTGGTYAGKTTLLSKLQVLGYPVVPDAGGQIISELNQKLGIDGQRRWRKKNPLAFYELITERQQNLEHTCDLFDEHAVFYDRGIPDYISMLMLTETEVPQRFWDTARLHPYDCAFVCETLSTFDNRAATGRSLDLTASLKLQSLCLEIYTELDCPTIILKESSLEDRIQLVLASIVLPKEA